ncbi:RBBP9/YdeN family alpha/beta hydrolase [Jiella mangrovi]|uniref:Serine hydrolase family protein n=1 Tax=Jiella mangrovi TaxID=2821407 RepID=A0ABS4BC52_9HYPH|nr:alpha/beta fold hydrolase [Jiella mangrovi]MBP0614122.1 serine hydrolase family protein [Jiella mangrovi]
MAKGRVVVLHGAHGGPDTNWFPWLHAELERNGTDVVRPRFPTPEGQSIDAWMAAYAEAVPHSVKGTILVGHSLGAAMALRVIERATEPFAGLFLAAPFAGALGLPDYDPINASFFAEPFEWKTIRQLRGTSCCCWAGDDDPYVPLARSQEVADHLGVPLKVVAGGGHLNDETGFASFPSLRDALLSALRNEHKAPEER